jgi:hypothetical protein
MTQPDDIGAAAAHYIVRRRRGKVDVLAVVDRFARLEGVDFDRELYEMVMRLVRGAGPENTRAAKLVLQYVAEDQARLQRVMARVEPPPQLPTLVPNGGPGLVLEGEDVADALDDFDEWKEQLRRERPQLVLVRPPVTDPKTIDELIG